MMDLIATNFKDGRQVAVSTTINQDYFAYANSWQQVGMVYNLGDEKPSFNIDLEGTLAWSSMMYRRQPIVNTDFQSAFMLNKLEEIVVRSAKALRRAGQPQFAVDLVNRYLSHLDYRQIFNRNTSLSLLKEMDQLGYDPVSIIAYATILRDTIEARPTEEQTGSEVNSLRALYYYIAHGEFPY